MKGIVIGGPRNRNKYCRSCLLPCSLKVDEFVTHEYRGIEALNEAMHVMHTPEANALRPVITF